jgi:ABC-type Fe3+ transport system permease subunit
MMPGLVLGIALLQFFRGLSLTQAWPALLMAPVVVTLSYAARTLIAGLGRFDFTMEAARMLGCSFGAALLRHDPGARSRLFDGRAVLFSGIHGQLPRVDLPD